MILKDALTDNAPWLSVVIATYGRHATALDNLSNADEWRRLANAELILVTNGPIQPTAEVLGRIKEAAGGNVFIALSEPAPGLSRARNAGWRSATSDFVLFLDDDCYPLPGFFAELRRALARFPATLVGGGPIAPRWPGSSRPAWLPQRYEWVYGGIVFPGHQDARPLRRNEVVNGGSFFARRRLLDTVGGFAVELGHIGATPGGGEEHELLERGRQLDPGAVICVPAARVEHRFPPERLNPQYALARLSAAARGRARVHASSKSSTERAARAAYAGLRGLVSKNPLDRANHLTFAGATFALLFGREP